MIVLSIPWFLGVMFVSFFVGFLFGEIDKRKKK